MAFISNNVLQEKVAPYAQILNLGFQYLLAGVAKEHAEINELKSIEEFNEKNKIGLANILVYPFFITVANGHSKALFSLFKDFRVSSFGLISMPVLDLLPKDTSSNNEDLQFFKINSQKNPAGIEICFKENYVDFEGLMKSIKSVPVNGESFATLTIESDKERERTPLFLAIEDGIALTKSKSENWIFNTDRVGLRHMANYFKVYNDFFNTKGKHSENASPIITYDQIEKPYTNNAYHLEKAILL